MKPLRILGLVFCLPVGMFLVGCGQSKGTDLDANQKKQEPFYKTEQNQPKNWEAEALWEEKIKTLSETKIPSFNSIDELSKEYIFKLACYKQVMSPEGLVYDAKKQKYIVDEADLQYFAKDLLGIDEFDFRESDEYNKEDGVYECGEYPDYEAPIRRYKDPKLEKLSDSQWEFSLGVLEGKGPEEAEEEDKAEGKSNGQDSDENDEYITEVYTIEDSENGYKLLSVKRLDASGQEILPQAEETAEEAPGEEASKDS